MPFWSDLQRSNLENIENGGQFLFKYDLPCYMVPSTSSWPLVFLTMRNTIKVTQRDAKSLKEPKIVESYFLII